MSVVVGTLVAVGRELLTSAPVLRWLICPPDVMRGQLDRLKAVVVVPNVRIGVLPMGRPLATTPQNAFTVVGDVVLVETFVGDQAAAFEQVMDQLWADAVEGEARQLIVAAAAALPA